METLMNRFPICAFRSWQRPSRTPGMHCASTSDTRPKCRRNENSAKSADQNAGDRLRIPPLMPVFDQTYEWACRLAADGRTREAVALLDLLKDDDPRRSTQARIENSRGAILAAAGDIESARLHFQSAISFDEKASPASQNLELLEVNSPKVVPETSVKEPVLLEPPFNHQSTKVAILSLLFNWPSTGGGTVHTAETAKFLSDAGYDVRHFYAEYAGWGIGRVDQPPPLPGIAVRFDEASWNEQRIRESFRQHVDAFAPDYVIIADSWNTKPLLAEAVQGYKYFLRLGGAGVPVPT